MVEKIIPAKIHNDLHRLRDETCVEFDNIFKHLNINKKMSRQKADIIIALRQDKLREFEARQYGVNFGKNKH